MEVLQKQGEEEGGMSGHGELATGEATGIRLQRVIYLALQNLASGTPGIFVRCGTSNKAKMPIARQGRP